MKKFFIAARAAVIILALAMGVMVSVRAESAWPADGAIPGTEINYSELSVSKGGVSVRLTNTSAADVKVSLKLTFLNRESSSLGYALFGLREIEAGNTVTISNNYLNGNWKACRDSARIDFSKMTYELLYY